MPGTKSCCLNLKINQAWPCLPECQRWRGHIHKQSTALWCRNSCEDKGTMSPRHGRPVKEAKSRWRMDWDCPCPNLCICEYVTFHGKMYLTFMIKLRVLRWGDYSEISRWAPCNHKGTHRKEGGRRKRRRCEGKSRCQWYDCWLWRWNGATSQRTRYWKRQGPDSSLDPPEGMQCCHLLILAP